MLLNGFNWNRSLFSIFINLCLRVIFKRKNLERTNLQLKGNESVRRVLRKPWGLKLQADEAQFKRFFGIRNAGIPDEDEVE